MPDPSVLDPQAIENLRALDPDGNDEFLREIVGIFLEDTPLRINDLDQSALANDPARFVRAAHSIKGSSANIGANALRTVAETLEHQSRTQGLAHVAALIAQVKAEFSRTQIALSELITK
jgi:HPt (histidine-containing phosphotransfer) domain-containing protein